MRLNSYLQVLVPGSQICYVNPGKQIPFSQGTQKYLYVLNSGYVIVRSNKISDSAFYGWRGAHTLLGELEVLSAQLSKLGLSALYPQQQSPWVVATDPCQLIRLTAVDFWKALNMEPIIYRNIVAVLMQKVASERGRPAVIQGASALPRVAGAVAFLHHERGFRANTHIIKGTIRTADIAGFVGLSAEAVADAINVLCQDEVILFGTHRGMGRGELKIIDLDRLKNEY